MDFYTVGLVGVAVIGVILAMRALADSSHWFTVTALAWLVCLGMLLGAQQCVVDGVDASSLFPLQCRVSGDAQ